MPVICDVANLIGLPYYRPLSLFSSVSVRAIVSGFVALVFIRLNPKNPVT